MNASFDPYDFSKIKIKGVPVYIKKLPWSPCVHVNVVFNVGAFDDPEGKEGLSHLLEHLVFDGSNHLPNKEEIDMWARKNTLNSWTAYTAFNHTNYYSKCFPDKFKKVIFDMKDMIFNPLLNDKDIDLEKKIILQELWSKLKNKEFLEYKRALAKNIFYGHNHSRFSSAFGWPETIEKITREDIYTYHRKKYSIGNFFIALTGAIKDEHIEMLHSFLENIPEAIDTYKKEKENFEPPKQKRTVITADMVGENREQTKLTISRFAEQRPHQLTVTDEISRRLLSNILYERFVKQKNWSYEIYVNSYTSVSFSQFSISLNTTTENIELVEKEFFTIIEDIKNDKFIEDFEKIKSNYIEQISIQEHLTSDIAEDAVFDIARYNGHIVTQKEELEQANKLSYSNIRDFILSTFDPFYIHTEIIYSQKKAAT